MKFLGKILLISLLFLPAASFAEDDFASFNSQSGTLKIAGGTAHIPVMKEAAKQIMTHNPKIKITIAGGGSGVGIKQVGEGIIDIGNSGRKATEQEVTSYGLIMVQWAIDGVAAVVNPANKVAALSGDQLGSIFAGTITNWKELGGVDKPINIYDRDAASGTRSVFWEKGLKKGEVSKKANVVVSNGAMKTAIAGDPYGIGYVSVGHIDSSITPITLDGVTPSLDTVKSGEFKIARGLYSLSKGEPAGLAKSFLDFLLSPTGQEIAVSKGFISVK